MNHADLMATFKSYYAELLEREKAKINADGPLTRDKVKRIQDSLQQWGEVIEADAVDVMDLLGVDSEKLEVDPTAQELQQIMNHNGFSFAPDSKEYGMMKSSYRHVKRNFLQDVLAYNSSVTDFSLLDTATPTTSLINAVKSGHMLGKVLESYLSELKPSLTTRSFNEQSDCLNYLIDWLGADYVIAKMDDAKAREAKELLRGTPNGRNKLALTKGQSVTDQVSIAKAHDLRTLSTTSINKYLAYFGSLFKWAKSNHYISENPFAGMRVKADKKKNRRREMYTRDEIETIISKLDDDVLVQNKSNYWGALIAIYTGARRNEIAALLPEDIKHDASTGIWYFDITDEEEQGKELKTEASARVVPIHSRLIEKGFLEFVQESRLMKDKVKHTGGYEPRLLYDLTYTEHEKWGRNLGRWFNERYLKAIGLKTQRKSLHSLRHSLITHLSMVGVEVATIKSIVGHEPDTVTTGVYTHYGIGHLSTFKAALEKLPY